MPLWDFRRRYEDSSSALIHIYSKVDLSRLKVKDRVETAQKSRSKYHFVSKTLTNLDKARVCKSATKCLSVDQESFGLNLIDHPVNGQLQRIENILNLIAGPRYCADLIQARELHSSVFNLILPDTRQLIVDVGGHHYSCCSCVQKRLEVQILELAVSVCNT